MRPSRHQLEAPLTELGGVNATGTRIAPYSGDNKTCQFSNMGASFKSKVERMMRSIAHGSWLLLLSLAFPIQIYAQTTATVSVENSVLNAGKIGVGKVRLDSPVPCNGILFLTFSATTSTNAGTPPRELGSADRFQLGSSELSFTVPTSFDDEGGEFALTVARFRCDSYSKFMPLKVQNSLLLTVIPVPDVNSYPTQAKVELNVTQKEFLETKAHQLDQLLVKFANGIQMYAASTEDQKQFLVGIIDSAVSDLNDTEAEYKRKMLKSGESMPDFFEDFRLHYSDLRIQVRGRKIEGNLIVPHLELAQLQLKKRPQPVSPIKPSVTLTTDADSTSHLIQDNGKAYRYVEDRGEAKFTTALMSTPSGARVSWRFSIRKDFTDYPTPTNVTPAEFPMAYLVFKFHKDNCGEDQYLRIDPWDNDVRTIKMEFSKCH